MDSFEMSIAIAHCKEKREACKVAFKGKRQNHLTLFATDNTYGRYVQAQEYLE